ncbi:hypothetical protein OWV82_018623 [Melia azedarach]|uniref:Uncharacterized protein n=1 Tax=Melia azedarach TaxID=155640 RepID=A0ACC1XBE3_MELAZ|nr:hypothetical protein OWV82_018623 [Melia azedarach]
MYSWFLCCKVHEAVLCNIPQLSNLKHLEIIITIYDKDCFLTCDTVLKASPLHKLIVKLLCSARSSRCVTKHQGSSIFKPWDLSVRVVELIGFKELTINIEFLMYFA